MHRPKFSAKSVHGPSQMNDFQQQPPNPGKQSAEEENTNLEQPLKQQRDEEKAELTTLEEGFQKELKEATEKFTEEHASTTRRKELSASINETEKQMQELQDAKKQAEVNARPSFVKSYLEPLPNSALYTECATFYMTLALNIVNLFMAMQASQWESAVLLCMGTILPPVIAGFSVMPAAELNPATKASANISRLLLIPFEELANLDASAIILVMSIVSQILPPAFGMPRAAHRSRGPPGDFQKYRLWDQSCSPPFTAAGLLAVILVDFTMIVSVITLACLVYSIAGWRAVLALVFAKMLLIAGIAWNQFEMFPLPSTVDKLSACLCTTSYNTVYSRWCERTLRVSTWTLYQNMCYFTAGWILLSKSWEEGSKQYDPALLMILLATHILTAVTFMLLYSYEMYVVFPREDAECTRKWEDVTEWLFKLRIDKRK